MDDLDLIGNPIWKHHQNNIDEGTYVRNEDGSVSTVYTTIMGDGEYEYLIPQVWDGKILEPEEAFQRAMDSGVDWPREPAGVEGVKRLERLDELLHENMVGFDKGGLVDEDRQTQEAFDATTGEAMALTPPRVEDQEADKTRRDTLTIESVPGFDRPMSASPDDEVVAQDELTGQLIYQTALGERYTISLNPDQRTARTRFEEDTLPAMQDYFENPTLPTVSQTAGFVGDIAQGAYETLEGAVQGRGTIGDVTGLAVGSGAGSMFGEVPEGALRIFGGFNAAADPGIDASGRALPRSVGADTLDRFEIDDSVATFNPQMLGGTDLTSKGLKNFDWAKVNANPRTYFATLDQVIDHPELFRQYPELGGVNVVVDTTIGPGNLGYYYEPGNLIAVSESVARSPKLFAETLIHEIQHDVQRREGFDRGTSARSQQVSDRAAPQLAELQTQYDTLSQDFDNFDFDNSLSKVADFANRLAEKANQDGSLGSTSFTYKSPVRDGKRNLDFLAGFLTTDPTDAKESYKRVIDFYSLIRDNPNLISPEDTEEFIRVFKIDPEELSQLSNQNFINRLESEGVIPVHPSSVLAERDLLRSRTYFERSGEVEARNVANRLGLTLDDRFNLHPVSTEDASAPRERQWTVDNEGNIREVRDFPVVPELEQQEGLLSRALRALRGNRGSEFNKGGVVSMEEQMSLFDMGGLTDDGAMRDPVSGNEVPPGSMATEVRDDVPAMLSEGEYIVPADVVRYYGVKFFEDLRGQAKSGLMDMERNGRIGGEPVGAPEDDLTPEEMAMLAEITGMYMGGDVRRPTEERMSVSEALANMSVYEAINSPVRVFTPEGAEATTPEMKRELFKNMGLIQIAEESGDQPRRAFQEGGVVDQPFTPIPNYNIPGFSMFQPTQTAAPAPAPVQTQNVTLYGPNGEVVTLTLPTDQERYNQLLGQGYTTQPRAPTQLPQAQDSGDDREDDFVFSDDDTPSGFLKPEMFDALNTDPLAFGQSMLEKKDFTRIAGGLGSIALGPFGGLAAGAISAGITANNVAQARAAVQIAKSRGLDTTELEANIDKYVEGLPNAARLMAGNVTGDRIVTRFNNQLEQDTGIAPTAPQPPSVTPQPSPAPTQTEAERQRQAAAQAEANRQYQASMQAAAAEAERQRQAAAQAEANRQYQASMQAAQNNDNDDRPTSWTGGSVAQNQSKPAAQSPSESRASAQRAADRAGVSMATRGRAKGGLVAKPDRKKPVAKKK